MVMNKNESQLIKINWEAIFRKTDFYQKTNFKTAPCFEGVVGWVGAGGSHIQVLIRRVLLIIVNKNMKKNQSWTDEEDRILCELASNSALSSCWTKVAQQMNYCFPEKSRFPKQCRDRFTNYIRFENSHALRTVWNPSQMDLLLSKYKQIGPKWTEISSSFLGKSENCLKNKFYGTLRKTVRNINMIFQAEAKKSKKTMKLRSVMKIFEYAEGRYRFQQNLFEKSLHLRQILLGQASNETSDIPFCQAIKLVDEVNEFNISIRSFKRSKKGAKRSTDQADQRNRQENSMKSEEKSDDTQKSWEKVEILKQNMQHASRLSKQNHEQFEEILLKEHHRQHHPGQSLKLVELEQFSHQSQSYFEDRHHKVCLDHLFCWCSSLNAEQLF